MAKLLVEHGLLVRERSKKDRHKVVLQISNDEALHPARIEEQVLASFVDLVEEVGNETADKRVEARKQVEQVLQRKFKQKTVSSR